MNAKAKGSRLERKSQKLLESKGYKVTKSGGSLGEFDLIAISDEDVRLIQVKANRNAPPAERKKIEEFKCPFFCEREIWIWKDFAREPKILWLDKGGKWYSLPWEDMK